MLKKTGIYLIAAVVVFLIVLMVGVFGMQLTWGESALLAAVVTIMGVGGYWWKDEGLG